MNRSTCASGSGYVPSDSIGFWVASTRNGLGTGNVWRPIVTWCSCITSSSADCTLAGARLISSASRKLQNTGPSSVSKSARSGRYTRVPTRSDGTRSGVNCTRWNVPPSTAAVVLIVRVFARPGTPSMSTWPPESRQTRTRSSISSWPAITRRISNRACSSLPPPSMRPPRSCSVPESMPLRPKNFSLISTSVQGVPPAGSHRLHFVPRPFRLVLGADANPARPSGGESCNAERRGLALRGHLDVYPQQVGLQLHQEPVRRRAAVRPEDARRLRQRFDHVGDLVRDRLQRGAHEVRRGRSAGDPADEAAGVGLPPGRPEPGQRRHEVDAVGRLDAAGELLALGCARDDAEPVAQPLHGRAAHEDSAFQRVAVGRSGLQKAVRRRTGVVARVDEHERAGAVGGLPFAGGVAPLSVERRLLVAGDPADRHRPSEQLTLADRLGGADDARQHVARDAEELEQLVVPVQRLE